MTENSQFSKGMYRSTSPTAVLKGVEFISLRISLQKSENASENDLEFDFDQLKTQEGLH